MRTLKKISSRSYENLYYQIYSSRRCVFWGPANIPFAKRAILTIAKTENISLTSHRFYALYRTVDNDGCFDGRVSFHLISFKLDEGKIKNMRFLEQKCSFNSEIYLEFSSLIPQPVSTAEKAKLGIFSLRGEY